eukprot:scaffold1618_cov158-Ochromonas_danica.AAC.8
MPFYMVSNNRMNLYCHGWNLFFDWRATTGAGVVRQSQAAAGSLSIIKCSNSQVTVEYIEPPSS